MEKNAVTVRITEICQKIAEICNRIPVILAVANLKLAKGSNQLLITSVYKRYEGSMTYKLLFML